MNLKISFRTLKQSLTRLPHPLIALRDRVTALLPARRMLAVEIAGHQIIGAVAEGKGRKLEVRNFVAIERSNATEDLPDPANLRELMDRLDYDGGPMVLVTPLARSVQISMSRTKIKKLRHYQLCDALRWEVEPYTGISGTQAMIGAEQHSPEANEELMLLTEDEIEVDVNVSVIEQNVYRAMRQVCKRGGLRLVRLYPPEVCFFMPLFLAQPESAQAVFDIGQDYANFTVVKGPQPKQINTYPLGRDVLMEMIEDGEQTEAEQSLGFLLRQVPGPLPLLLTGIGATQAEIVEYLNSRCEYGAKAMELSRSDKLGRAGHDGLNALYSVVAGAALREISGTARQLIGITDTIPLPVRIRRSGHLFPIGVAALMAAGLLGHYGYMKNSRERYKAQATKLESQTKERKQKFDAFEKIENEQKELERKIGLYKKRIAFLEQGADDNLIHLEQVLRSFFDLPPEMQLESLLQEKNGKFLLQGTTDDFAVVGRFAVSLQQQKWCRAVNIKVLERQGNEGLHFQIQLDTIGQDAGEAEEEAAKQADKQAKSSKKKR